MCCLFQARDVNSLRMKFKNIKKKLTKSVADERRARMATGGGKAPKEYFEGDEVYVELLELISLGVHGHTAEFDDDADMPPAPTSKVCVLPAAEQEAPETQQDVQVVGIEQIEAPLSPLFSGFDIDALEVEYAEQHAGDKWDNDSDGSDEYEDNNRPSTSSAALARAAPSTSFPKMELTTVHENTPPLQIDSTPPPKIEPGSQTNVLWNKYSAAMLRKKKNTLLVTKRKFNEEGGGSKDDDGIALLKRTCIENAIQYAKEKHAVEMANLKLTQMQLKLAIAKAKVELSEGKAGKRLRLKKLKAELHCEMVGYNNTTVSSDDSSDTSVSDAEWRDAVRSDVEDINDENVPPNEDSKPENLTPNN